MANHLLAIEFIVISDHIQIKCKLWRAAVEAWELSTKSYRWSPYRSVSNWTPNYPNNLSLKYDHWIADIIWLWWEWMGGETSRPHSFLISLLLLLWVSESEEPSWWLCLLRQMCRRGFYLTSQSCSGACLCHMLMYSLIHSYEKYENADILLIATLVSES